MKLKIPSLNSPRALVWVALFVPVFFGLVSIWLGADENFDLRNYHLYNAYAFLTGRLSLDMAPTGVQSYFNPVLDLPYYYMSLHWPARLVGFIMGFLHGLNFVLLLVVARRTLPTLPPPDRYRVPLLLAVAGCLTANFLTELGNTMGDATTSLFELGALCLILWNWERLLSWSWRGAALLLLAGVVSGLGMGLKLTNAIYAVALCLSLLTVPIGWVPRLRLAFMFGTGVLLGLAAVSGFWYLELWHAFGNPLYPQFSSLFPNPMTEGIGQSDTHYVPKSLWQMLLWPFLLTLDSRHVSELRVLQIIWAALYLLFLLWGMQALSIRSRGGSRPPMDMRRRYLLVYIAVAFILWMKLFSIYRYLIAIELLAPFAVFILLAHLLDYEKGKRAAGWVLGVATFVVLMGATRSWGHVPWADPLLRAETPAISTPVSTTVLTVGEADGGPYAWLAIFFPREVAFLGVHTSFPASRDYVQHVHDTVRRRGGPVYALIAGYGGSSMNAEARAEEAPVITRINAWASRLGFAESDSGCLLLRWTNEKLGLDAGVQQTPMSSGSMHCELALPQDAPAMVADKDRYFASEYAAALRLYGFQMDTDSCRVYTGHIGQGLYPYQWCRVTEVNGPWAVVKHGY